VTTGGAIPIVERARLHRNSTAVVAREGSFSYDALLASSAVAATRLLDGASDLSEGRVAFLIEPSFAWVATQWAVWRAGGIAVPLCVAHPRPELEHVIADSGAEILVADAQLRSRVEPIARERGLRLLSTEELNEASEDTTLPAVEPERAAMIVYTSGTTGRPKGAVTTHGNIAAQVESLVEAWRWSPDDHILHVLPLHHVHGIVNVLSCALWAGATCEILPAFDGDLVWSRFVDGHLTLFMAVPTIYSKLISAWEEQPIARQRELSEACHSLRLMVSGSAALPVKTLERWREISGHLLLERYGMTEIGMALSNPLDGERRPGHVGAPLPGVEVRRLDEAGQPAADESPAELEVRGPSVFREYWNRPEATAEAFRDGWFRTGDIAVVDDGSYRLLGRDRVDIIKTGGYKVSALEIEECLREHPAIDECAVVGIPDDEWGERVAAAVVLHEGEDLLLAELRAWSKERIAAYKVPSRLELVEALPRNAMGKVTKPAVTKLFG
jgi:malonyl-CoA/methylmalonyl-CoA synthetase